MKLSNRVLEMEESVTLAANARAKALAAEGHTFFHFQYTI